MSTAFVKRKKIKIDVTQTNHISAPPPGSMVVCQQGAREGACKAEEEEGLASHTCRHHSAVTSPGKFILSQQLDLACSFFNTQSPSLPAEPQRQQPKSAPSFNLLNVCNCSPCSPALTTAASRSCCVHGHTTFVLSFHLFSF